MQISARVLTLTKLSPLLFAISLPLAARADSPIRLDTPAGGWRPPSDTEALYTQPVNYPAASVTTPEGQAQTARIRGQIALQGKLVSGPAKLVVNGVAMPLRIDEGGSIDRPYIFAAGSNNVEVRDPHTNATRRVQFLQTGAGQVPAKLRVVLAWDSDGTDLDLHVITPDGGHAWYGSRVLANGGALDMDVTTGYGPEIFSTPSPLKGRYLVYVNYYGGSSEEDQAITTATLTLIAEEGTPNEKMETLMVPLRKSGELTLVKSFGYP